MHYAIFLIALPLFLVCAAVADIRRREIPNLLTASMAVAGVVLSLVGVGVAAPSQALLAGSVSLAIGLGLQALRLTGGGDVKLFAALALWLGPSGSIDAALAMAISGGVLALFFLRRSRSPNGAGESAKARTTLGRLQLDAGPDTGRVPYGVAIAAGGLWVWSSHLGASG